MHAKMSFQKMLASSRHPPRVRSPRASHNHDGKLLRERLPCPICGLPFPIGKLEEHADACAAKLEPRAPPPAAASANELSHSRIGQTACQT